MSESIGERNARYCLNKGGFSRYRADGKHVVCSECGHDFGLGDFTGSLPLHDRDASPEALLRRALPLLERLGDFIGNGDVSPTRVNSLGVRCDLILDIKRALEQ